MVNLLQTEKIYAKHIVVDLYFVYRRRLCNGAARIDIIVDNGTQIHSFSVSSAVQQVS